MKLSAEKRIGLCVRAHRKKKRLSQKELARHLGVDQARVSRIETGKAFMFLSEWWAFCKAVDIEVKEIPE